MIRRPDDVVGQCLGERPIEIDTSFGYLGYDAGIYFACGRGTGGADLDGISGVVRRRRCGDLGAVGVVDADEQNARGLSVSAQGDF